MQSNVSDHFGPGTCKKITNRKWRKSTLDEAFGFDLQYVELLRDVQVGAPVLTNTLTKLPIAVCYLALFFVIRKTLKRNVSSTI